MAGSEYSTSGEHIFVSSWNFRREPPSNPRTGMEISIGKLRSTNTTHTLTFAQFLVSRPIQFLTRAHCWAAVFGNFASTATQQFFLVAPAEGATRRPSRLSPSVFLLNGSSKWREARDQSTSCHAIPIRDIDAPAVGKKPFKRRCRPPEDLWLVAVHHHNLMCHGGAKTVPGVDISTSIVEDLRIFKIEARLG